MSTAFALLAPLRINQSAEIAAPHGFGRHGGAARRALPQLESLISDEEERTVAPIVAERAKDGIGQPDGAADRAAEFVADQLRRFAAGIKVLPRARQPEAVIAMRFKGRAVNLIRAAFGRQDSGGRTVEFRRGVVGLDADFLNRVQTGQPLRSPAEVAVGQDRAILDVFKGRRAQAADAEPAAAAFDARRRQQHQRIEVPPVDRQLLDARAVDRAADGWIVGGEELRDIPGHGHRLADIGDGQRCVNDRALADLEQQFAFPFLHAAGFDRDFVPTDRQRRREIEARLVGRDVSGLRGRRLRNGDPGAGNHRASRIAHRALNGSRARLRVRVHEQ